MVPVGMYCGVSNEKKLTLSPNQAFNACASCIALRCTREFILLEPCDPVKKMLECNQVKSQWSALEVLI